MGCNEERKDEHKDGRKDGRRWAPHLRCQHCSANMTNHNRWRQRSDPRSTTPTTEKLISPPKVTFCDMSDQSGSYPFQVLFESALKDYENKTGISLANHPFAEQLQNCQSVDSVTTLLQEQARAFSFSEIRGSDKIMKLLETVVSGLSKVSAIATLGQDIGMVFPKRFVGCYTSLTHIR